MGVLESRSQESEAGWAQESGSSLKDRALSCLFVGEVTERLVPG